MKRLKILQASPRQNGNTRKISNFVMDKCIEKGVEVSETDVTKLKFKYYGCSGCGKCDSSSTNKCVINDEVSDVIADLINYDCIVFATPLYWFNCSGIMKCFIDRLHSLSYPIDHNKTSSASDFSSSLKGKTLGLLVTGAGGVEDNFIVFENNFITIADFLKCKVEICYFAYMPHDKKYSITDDNDKISQAEEFVKRILS